MVKVHSIRTYILVINYTIGEDTLVDTLIDTL